MQNIKIYLITDSVGETAKKIISAVVAQFPTVDLSDVQLYPFTNDKASLLEILNDAKKENALVAITLVDKSLVACVKKFSDTHDLAYVDFMSPLMHLIEERSGEQPTQESGSVHRLNQAYFNRVAAIEFAVKYDDGKDPKGFLNADIVLLGVSRTSKTPLSMYLANKGYKVANLPIIPEVEVAKELYKVDPRKIIGLTSTSESLSNIRSYREQTLGLKKNPCILMKSVFLKSWLMQIHSLSNWASRQLMSVNVQLKKAQCLLRILSKNKKHTSAFYFLSYRRVSF